MPIHIFNPESTVPTAVRYQYSTVNQCYPQLGIIHWDKKSEASLAHEVGHIFSDDEVEAWRNAGILLGMEVLRKEYRHIVTCLVSYQVPWETLESFAKEVDVPGTTAMQDWVKHIRECCTDTLDDEAIWEGGISLE